MQSRGSGTGVAVGAYLGAIVAANLLVAAFGPGFSIVNAFLFVGLDLTLRDRLHDAWGGRQLIPRMALLIASGGILSWIVNRDAAAIAFASTVAFVLASIADTLTYALLGDRSRLVRVNGSNAIAAAVDSLAFSPIAFGVILPAVILGQYLAKLLGGLAWSLVLPVPEADL
jgi:queuosine precursor transporter